ncbi:uncharacterized protein TNIN_11271 [Trichonephila inaurata madagascariensis]|uniref:Gustatory receptor n=1 Tax=Trichonephila inaurata madagascariensis TaxID=2747483 RepID=A0A8X6X6M8_9ARAC|nr:uncharacterized protein TNIN_11271 [Trichonephila inaurata madagascariensis]
MESLEHFLCFSVFLSVVCSMTGMFWLSYKLIFVTKNGYVHFLSSIIGEMYYCSIIAIVILSASSANTAAEVAKEAVMSLPGRIPQYYNELKAILRKDCKQTVTLTVWKLYKIDRTLFISVLGVLVSYGILIATLGSVNSCIDK